MKAGIHSLTAEEYHRDLCDAPSLSSSVARTLIAKSPAHAKADHPRLSPDLVREEKKEFDIGTAAHAMLLGDTSAKIVELPFENYRKKDAQTARDDAYAAGATPILSHQMAELRLMVTAAKAQIAAHREAADAFGATGKAEQTVIWQEKNGVWCRARLDWLSDARNLIYDAKTTGMSAEPDAWSRYLFNEGYDMQAAWYRRGIRALTGKSPVFRFVVMEIKPPYAMSVLELLPAALAQAEEKIEQAIDLWGRCLRDNRWPGYANVTYHVDAPGWIALKHEERKEREASLKRQGVDMLAMMTDWQSPKETT